MATLQQQEMFRCDVTRYLREMAAQGASLTSMIQYVQDALGHSERMIVPTLAYFCHAFSLPLPVVLPLREWPENESDAEIVPLLKHLESLANENARANANE